MHVDTDTGEMQTEGRLRRSGDSTVVTLPPGLLDAVGLEAYDDVVFACALDGDTIEIRPKNDGEE